MSQLSVSNNTQRDFNHYFDQNMKIWYSDDGVAVRTLLYLAPLGDHMTRDDIFDYCSCFGKVEEVRIHHEAKQSFGYVTFHQSDSVTKALTAESHTIGGHQTIFTIVDQGKKLTTTSVIGFTDLNDDCLYEIFSKVSIMDLCSIARTSTRFMRVCSRVFTTNYQKCDLKWITKKHFEARRIIVTFGPVISELLLGPHPYRKIFYGHQGAVLLHLATSFCGETLQSLTLDSILIPKWLALQLRPMFNRLQKLHVSSCALVGIDYKNVFPNCESLVELKVTDENSGIDKFLFENTFPKLERFSLKRTKDLRPTNIYLKYFNLKDFVSRHQNLRSFSLKECPPSGLIIVAEYCKQLEEFEFLHGREYGHFNEYDEAFKILLNRLNLRKLRVNSYSYGDIRKMVQLWNAQGDVVIVPATKVHKYAGLQKLEISDFKGDLKKVFSIDPSKFKNCNFPAELSKLKRH